MYPLLLSLILTNTYSLSVNHGICSYDFAVRAEDTEYRNLEIWLKPNFTDPASNPEFAGGIGEIRFDVIGSNNADRNQRAFIEADCGTESFTVTKATAIVDGKPVDLLATHDLQINIYEPLPVQLNQTSVKP